MLIDGQINKWEERQLKSEPCIAADTKWNGKVAAAAATAVATGETNHTFFFDRSMFPLRRHHINKSHFWISDHLWWRRRLPSSADVWIADFQSLIDNSIFSLYRSWLPNANILSSTPLRHGLDRLVQNKRMCLHRVVLGYDEIWCEYMSFDRAKSRWQKRKNPIQNIHHDFVRQLVSPSRLRHLRVAAAIWILQAQSHRWNFNKNDAHSVSQQRAGCWIASSWDFTIIIAVHRMSVFLRHFPSLFYFRHRRNLRRSYFLIYLVHY